MTTERRGGQGAGPVQPLHPSGQRPCELDQQAVSSLQSPGRGWGRTRKGSPGLAQRELPGGRGPLRLLLLPWTLSTFRAPICSQAGRAALTDRTGVLFSERPCSPAPREGSGGGQGAEAGGMAPPSLGGELQFSHGTGDGGRNSQRRSAATTCHTSSCCRGAAGTHSPAFQGCGAEHASAPAALL